jgi:hypothetical protein
VRSLAIFAVKRFTEDDLCRELNSDDDHGAAYCRYEAARQGTLKKVKALLRTTTK